MKKEITAAVIGKTFLSHAIIVVLGFAMIYPILWLIMASFKEGSMVFSDPSLLPKVWTIQNYVKGWQGIGIVPFSTFFINSFIICIACTVINAAACPLPPTRSRACVLSGENSGLP